MYELQLQLHYDNWVADLKLSNSLNMSLIRSS